MSETPRPQANELPEFAEIKQVTYAKDGVANAGANHVYGVDAEGKKHHIKQLDVMGVHGYGKEDVAEYQKHKAVFESQEADDTQTRLLVEHAKNAIKDKDDRYPGLVALGERADQLHSKRTNNSTTTSVLPLPAAELLPPRVSEVKDSDDGLIRVPVGEDTSRVRVFESPEDARGAQEEAKLEEEQGRKAGGVVGAETDKIDEPEVLIESPEYTVVQKKLDSGETILVSIPASEYERYQEHLMADLGAEEIEGHERNLDDLDIEEDEDVNVIGRVVMPLEAPAGGDLAQAEEDPLVEEAPSTNIPPRPSKRQSGKRINNFKNAVGAGAARAVSGVTEALGRLGSSSSERQERGPNSRRNRIIGGVALLGAGIAGIMLAKRVGIDVVPYFDGDGIDLYPFNNHSGGGGGSGLHESATTTQPTTTTEATTTTAGLPRNVPPPPPPPEIPQVTVGPRMNSDQLIKFARMTSNPENFANLQHRGAELILQHPGWTEQQIHNQLVEELARMNQS